MENSLFTKKDLYIAYKKVKFELFNDKNSVATLKLFEFESDLDKNINILFKKIKDGNLLNKNLECNGFFELPKSFEDQSVNDNIHFFSSALNHHDFDSNNTSLKFRKIINANIDFHIISALWISKVGKYIDERFDSNIYGARLTRIKPVDTSSCEYDLSSQEYNESSPKIFDSYHHKYQAWRNNSFKTIRELHKTSSVIAITMDITSFYHSIKLREFISKDFYRKFNLDNLFHNKELKTFHISFIKLLMQWNKSTKSKFGLPIGLSASSVLANAVMKDFDDMVKKNLSPTYYGRYVDDILLVFPDNGNLYNGENVIKYLINKEIVSRGESDELKYKNLILKESKQKIFYLDKNADLSIIDGIEAEVNAISSEWRFLPDIADDNSSLLQKVVGFYADGKEFNDALRKIDATTIKRLGLSLLVSHAHSLNQYIGAKEWKVKRLKVYDLIENHIFIPKNLFENYIFLSRIFRLMLHSGDGERAFCFLQKLNDIIEKLESVSEIKSSNNKSAEFHKFKEYYYEKFKEVFFETYTIQNPITGKYFNKIKEILNIEKDQDEIKKLNSNLIMYDLAFDSFSKLVTEYILTKNEKCLFFNIVNHKEISLNFKNSRILEKCFSKSEYFQDKYNINKDLLEKFCINNFNLNKYVLIFPTRLLTPLDVSIAMPDINEEMFIKIVNFLRGTHSKSLYKNKNYDIILDVVEVENKEFNKHKQIDIAITNYEVKNEYWEKSIIKEPIKSLERFINLQHIVNEAVIKKPNYLVLPELSIPQEWAWLISQKLLSNNISLITGVEYIHTIDEKKEPNQKIVHNSIMMFLISDNIGFKYMKYFRQDKIKGAYQESIDLYNKANIKLEADVKYKKKKIYKHGDFFFSSLICNELTDIENRFNLRGNIDCLFAIEWNRDIKSFNALVESVSLDIHSYIVQVNNRNYGDSRIRAPYKNEFKRDIVQVRGGRHDYLIVGEINIEKLREFQSHNISPSKDFKPVPTGFEMLKEREKWSN